MRENGRSVPPDLGINNERFPKQQAPKVQVPRVLRAMILQEMVWILTP